MTMNLSTNWKMHVGLAVFCAGILSIAYPGPAAAADAGTPPAAQQADQNIESLLRLVEQRIVTDHTSSPAGDSAVDAWKQVIQVVPVTDSARVGSALTTFAIHLRRRAAEEQKAGNVTVAEDMAVFASEAEGLKEHSLGPATAAASAPQPTETPPKFEPLAGSMPPITPPPQQPEAKPSIAEFYAWRGDLMLAKKDVAAARKYYELAASAGSARAAMQLTRINDPGLAAQSNAEPEAPAQPHPHPHRRRVRVTEEPLGVGRIY
jgi:hypothetical protein